MRAAALAAAVIAGFLGVMYLRFSGDTAPAPRAASPYVAAQPTCVVFRLASEEDSELDTSCGAIDDWFQPSPWPPPIPGPSPTTHPSKRGPFVRVVNTEGTCLNVRAEPGAAGQVLGCAAEGVSIRDLGLTVVVEDVTWLRVVTPDGVEGWASGQYLER